MNKIYIYANKLNQLIKKCNSLGVHANGIPKSAYHGTYFKTSHITDSELAKFEAKAKHIITTRIKKYKFEKHYPGEQSCTLKLNVKYSKEGALVAMLLSILFKTGARYYPRPKAIYLTVEEGVKIQILTDILNGKENDRLFSFGEAEWKYMFDTLDIDGDEMCKVQIL